MTPIYDFDAVIDRQHSDSIKWRMYPEDVLPLWVADTDFSIPPAITQALQARISHELYGYPGDAVALRALIVERLHRLYQWDIQPQEIVFVPGLVSAISLISRVLLAADEQVLVQPPIYPPFLSVPAQAQREVVHAPLREIREGATLRYEMDFDALEAAITPKTRLFLLCNPHNPTGRSFSRDELKRVAEICERHNVLIVSDEIHCDLLMAGTVHTPIATLSPEVGARTITMMAPSKTFNIAGLGCGFMIVPHEETRKQLITAAFASLPFVNVLGYTAAEAAYRDGQEWLMALLPYLQANRDYVCDFVVERLPNVAVTCPEATYLAWLDFRQTPAAEDPYRFMLTRAKVGLNDGKPFGAQGEGFLRLNFGCPRATLTEALERIAASLTSV